MYLSTVTSLGFAYVLGLSFWQSISFIFYVVFVDCIFVGIIIASFFWAVTNRYLRTNSLEPDIEWGYAFDVHLNAFFPPLMLLHFIQLFFYNWLISQTWFISRFLGNTFWLMGMGYYVYITFLGYNCKLLNASSSSRIKKLSSCRHSPSEKHPHHSHRPAHHLSTVSGRHNYWLERNDILCQFLQVSRILVMQCAL